MSRLRARSGFGSGAPLEPHSIPNPVRLSPMISSYKQKHHTEVVLLFVVEVGRVECRACGLGRGSALGLHWSPIQYRTQFDSPP